jgi:hypothetical protein
MRFTKGGITYQDLNNMPIAKAINLGSICSSIAEAEEEQQKLYSDKVKARQQYMGR